MAWGAIEFTEVDRHIDFSLMEAKVAMMIRHFDRSQNSAHVVRLDELCRKTPEKYRFAVGTDALQVM